MIMGVHYLHVVGVKDELGLLYDLLDSHSAVPPSSCYGFLSRQTVDGCDIILMTKPVEDNLIIELLLSSNELSVL